MLKLTQANSANCMQSVEVSLQGNRLRPSQLYECKTREAKGSWHQKGSDTLCKLNKYIRTTIANGQ